MTTSITNSGVSATLLLSVLCLGLAMMFVGGWYFQSSLVELQPLQAQQQETTQIVQQLKEKVRKQSKPLNELRSQLEMK